MASKRIASAVVAAVVALGASIAVSAVASTASATSGSESAARVAATGIQAAQQLVAQYTAVQKPITLKPLPKHPSGNVRIGAIYCTIPACTPNAVTQAIATIGWKAQLETYALTPTTYVQAWARLMQRPPQVILFEAVFPNALIAKYLAQAAKLNIPVVSVTTAEPSIAAALSGPVKGCFVCQPEFALDGKLMAAVVAADAKQPTSVAYVEDPALVASTPINTAFAAGLNSFDPGSSVAVVQVSSFAPPTQNSSAVVSYVQSHPEVKYLVFNLASLAAGVPQALASAGLAAQVKIVDRPPQAVNLADVKAGTEFVTVADEDPSAVWRAVDALARIVEHVKVTAPAPVGWHRIITQANVASIATYQGSPAVPGFPGAFLKAWHIAKVAK